MFTISDVEKYLGEARDLQEDWISNGWETLYTEEVEMSDEILDIYPLVEVDISVTITIKLPHKTYIVPLEDVSPLNVNDCLVIGVNDLYLDWEKRVKSKLGYLTYETTIFNDKGKWHEARYVGEDRNTRIVRLKTD